MPRKTGNVMYPKDRPGGSPEALKKRLKKHPDLHLSARPILFILLHCPDTQTPYCRHTGSLYPPGTPTRHTKVRSLEQAPQAHQAHWAHPPGTPGTSGTTSSPGTTGTPGTPSHQPTVLYCTVLYYTPCTPGTLGTPSTPHQAHQTHQAHQAQHA